MDGRKSSPKLELFRSNLTKKGNNPRKSVSDHPKSVKLPVFLVLVGRVLSRQTPARSAGSGSPAWNDLPTHDSGSRNPPRGSPTQPITLPPQLLSHVPGEKELTESHATRTSRLTASRPWTGQVQNSGASATDHLRCQQHPDHSELYPREFRAHTHAVSSRTRPQPVP